MELKKKKRKIEIEDCFLKKWNKVIKEMDISDKRAKIYVYILIYNEYAEPDLKIGVFSSRERAEKYKESGNIKLYGSKIRKSEREELEIEKWELR